METMYEWLIQLIDTFRRFASDAEQAEYLRLTREEEATEDKARRVSLNYEREVLAARVHARRDASTASAEGDEERAKSIITAHEVWRRRMTAVRSALDDAGLRRARASVKGDQVNICIDGRGFSEIAAEARMFKRLARERLGCLRARFWWAFIYPYVQEGETGAVYEVEARDSESDDGAAESESKGTEA